MTDRVRVMRVLIYEGPRDWMETTLNKSIKGTIHVGHGATISAATIGEFPEIIKAHEEATKEYL
jgi:hypothetical protein